MKLLILLSALTVSASAFGVVPPRRARTVTVASYQQQAVVLLYSGSNDDDDAEDIVQAVVADDEWMRLTLNLTSVVMEQVKKFCAEVLEEDEFPKLGSAAQEVKADVSEEVLKLRYETSRDAIEDLATNLVSYIETKVIELTDEADYRLGDFNERSKKEMDDIANEVESRIRHEIAQFSDGRSKLRDLKLYIESQVDARIAEAKDRSDYEAWKFKNEVEARQQKLIEEVLDPEQYHEFRQVAKKARKLARSTKDFFYRLFGRTSRDVSEKEFQKEKEKEEVISSQ